MSELEKSMVYKKSKKFFSQNEQYITSHIIIM